MNRKNIILTMLACLNCVHTTHAVETSEYIQDQDTMDSDLESLDKLEEQCKLQNLRISIEEIYKGTPNRDAAIKREIIMQKVYKHKKTELLPNDPLCSFYEDLRNIRGEVVKDLRKLGPDDSESFALEDARFYAKIKKWVRSGKITGLIVDITRKNNCVVVPLDEADETFPNWLSNGNVPSLALTLNPRDPQTIRQRLTPYEQDMKELQKKYPGIAKQRRDVYRKMWAYDLNSSIKNEDQWIGNIEAGLQELDESNTEIGQDMKETVLDTLRNNLIGANQNRKARTIALLAKNPVLKQMVKLDGPEMKTMLTDPRNKLVYAFAKAAKKEGDRPSITRVPAHVFNLDVVKYL